MIMNTCVHNNGYCTTRRYANSRTGQLADWTSRKLDNSQMPPAAAVAVFVVFTLIYEKKTLHRSQHVLGAINMLG